MALALLPALSARDLWPPDEPRYGQVAREMLERGTWIRPEANGEPYAEKPPLFFAAVAALSAPLGGVTPWSARLVGAACAAAAVLLTARLARRWFGDPGVGSTAAALAFGHLLVAWNAGRAGLDLPLTAAVLLTVERAGAWLRTGRSGPAFGAGLAWAAAVLLKGPLGLLLPVGVVAAEAWALGRRPRLPGLLLATGTLGLVAGGWLALALGGAPEAYRARLLGQIAGRVTGAEGHHLGPPWEYLLVWPVMALPLSAPLALGAAVALRPWRAAGEARAGLSAAFVAGPLLFTLLSLTATKRDLYLIPGTPFVAAAAAWALVRGVAPRWRAFGRRLSTGTLAVLAAGALAFPWLGRRFLHQASSAAAAPVDLLDLLALAPAAVLLGLGAYGVHRSGSDAASGARRGGTALLAAFTALALLYLPRLDRLLSFRPVAEAALAAAGDGPVAYAGFHQPANLLWALPRARVEPVADAATLARALPPGGRAAVVATAGWWDALRSQAAADPDLGALLAHVEERWRDQRGRALYVVLAPRRP